MALYTSRSRQADRSGNQCYLSTCLCKCPGQGKPHFPGTAVADETDRIDRLASRAGSHNDPDTGQPRTGERRGDSTHQRVGLQHAPQTAFTAGLLPLGRAPDLHIAFAQQRDIVTCRRVAPHGLVHGRRNSERRGAGQTDSAQQVIGPTLRQPRQSIGARGCDHDQVRPARQLDMVHSGSVIGPVAPDALAAERLEGPGGNKTGRGGRHNHPNRGPDSPQSAYQFGALVGGDTAANAK